MIRKTILALALFFLVCIGSNAAAFADEDVQVYETVYLKGEKSISVSVYNYSAVDKNIGVDFIAPSKIQFEFTGLDDTVNANMKASFKLKLTPLSESMEGKQYKTTLVVWLGNEMVRKEIFINFLKNETVVTEKANNGSTDNTNNMLVPYFVLNMASIELVVNILLAVIAVILASMLILRIKENR